VTGEACPGCTEDALAVRFAAVDRIAVTCPDCGVTYVTRENGVNACALTGGKGGGGDCRGDVQLFIGPTISPGGEGRTQGRTVTHWTDQDSRGQVPREAGNAGPRDGQETGEDRNQGKRGDAGKPGTAGT